MIFSYDVAKRWIAALSIAMAAWFLVYYWYFPSILDGADACAYSYYAFRFRRFGPLSDYGGVRTYGYPLFLYAASFLSGFNPQRLALLAGAVQYAAFFAAALWAARQVRAYSERL